MAWQPTWQLLVAFNNGSQDDPGLITSVASPAGTLGANNVWTDVTPYIIGKVATNRGRQHELDKFQPGTLTVTLNNNGGVFDSWNTSGPYTGKITPGVPVQFRGTFSASTYKLFTGVADVWTSLWPSESSAQVTLQAVDQFSYFNYATCVSSLYAAQVVTDGAAAFFKLTDPVGWPSNNLTDSSGNSKICQVAAEVTPGSILSPSAMLGGSSLLANSTDTSIALPAGDIVGRPIISGAADWIATSATAVSLEFWFSTTAAGPFYANLTWTHSATMYGVGVEWGSAAINNLVSGTKPNTVSVTICDGNPHHIVVTGDTGAGTSNVYIDGVNVIASTGLTFTGGPWTITDTNPNASNFCGVFNGSSGVIDVQEMAAYPSVLSSGQVTSHHSLGGAAPVEASGTRIGRILNWKSFPAGPRNIDTGVSNVQAITTSIATTSIMSYLQSVELSEYGALFMTGDGKVRFMSRNTVWTTAQSSAAATFGDGGGSEIPFELGPQIALDTLDLYNQIQLTRAGGNVQRVGTGVRVYQASGLLNTTDNEVYNYANWLLVQYGTAMERIRSITIHPIVDPTGTATTTILGLDLMTVVTVNRHTLPGAGTLFTQTAFVEGINHHVDPVNADWTVDFQLAPVGPPVWILGTSKLGQTTRLGF